MSLYLDISTLKDGSQEELLFDYHGKLSFPEDNIEDCSINTRLKINNIGEGLYIKGILDINLNLICSRCIETFCYKNNIELEEVCNYHEEDPCDNYFEEDNLNMKELLRQKIHLFLPLKPLCNEECKGLCPECSTNLNEKKCSCKIAEVDYRWMNLKDAFMKGGKLEI